MQTVESTQRLTVPVTWPEVWLAGDVALYRAVKNLQGKLQDRNGDTGMLGLDYHFLGCLGELAFAKHINVFWSGNVGQFKTADVHVFQVRSCSRENDCLLLHEWDAKTDIFINALIIREKLPEVTLRGWLIAEDGQKDEYWGQKTGRDPAYWVPASVLKPMSEFTDILAKVKFR